MDLAGLDHLTDFLLNPLVFPLFWLLISWVLSRFSGWGRLADRFPDEGPLVDDAHYLGSGRFDGFVNYSGILVAGFMDQGLQLRVLLPFRFGHAPLLIPWSEVSYRGEQRGLFVSRHRFILGDVHVRLTGSFGEAIRDRALANERRPILRRRVAGEPNDEQKLATKPVDDEFERFRAAKLAEAAAASLPDLTAERRPGAERCPYCHDDIRAQPAAECTHCGTLHHAECLAEHGGCVVLACRGRVRQ